MSLVGKWNVLHDGFVGNYLVETVAVNQTDIKIMLVLYSH